MKKTRVFFMIAFLLFAVGFGQAVPESRVEAATLKNVLKAPKAKAGSWLVGNRYRYKSNGRLAKNTWLNIEGYIYYFKKNGYPNTGWVTYNKKKYFFDGDGALVTGWLKKGGKRYYLSKADGSVKLGKKKIGSSWYYFHPSSGYMLTGWRKINGYYYYFDKKTGIMAVNKKVGKYYVDKNGRRRSSSAAPASGSPNTEKTGKIDIFVGDSRTVGMCNAKHGDNCTKCIAEVNMGYDWLVSTAIPQLKQKLKKNPNATVVFNLGINDVANYSKYISKYKTLVKKYPKARFFFMSVNPVGTKYKKYGWFLSYDSMRQWINKFNKALKNAFPNQYIDCYNYLMKNGFSTVDGVHYTTSTYKKIYNYMIKQV